MEKKGGDGLSLRPLLSLLLSVGCVVNIEKGEALKNICNTCTGCCSPLLSSQWCAGCASCWANSAAASLVLEVRGRRLGGTPAGSQGRSGLQWGGIQWMESRSEREKGEQGWVTDGRNLSFFMYATIKPSGFTMEWLNKHTQLFSLEFNNYRLAKYCLHLYIHSVFSCHFDYKCCAKHHLVLWTGVLKSCSTNCTHLFQKGLKSGNSFRQVFAWCIFVIIVRVVNSLAVFAFLKKKKAILPTSTKVLSV